MFILIVVLLHVKEWVDGGRLRCCSGRPDIRMYSAEPSSNDMLLLSFHARQEIALWLSKLVGVSIEWDVFSVRVLDIQFFSHTRPREELSHEHSYIQGLYNFHSSVA